MHLRHTLKPMMIEFVEMRYGVLFKGVFYYYSGMVRPAHQETNAIEGQLAFWLLTIPKGEGTTVELAWDAGWGRCREATWGCISVRHKGARENVDKGLHYDLGGRNSPGRVSRFRIDYFE